MRGRVLVVGLGFLGLHVVRSLHRAAIPVTVLTRSEPSLLTERVLAHADLFIGSPLDEAIASEALQDVAHVIWCAGGLMPAEANDEPVRHVSGAHLPLLAMLEALRERGVVDLLFFSSGGTVYGEQPDSSLVESCATAPLTMHGIASLTSERYLARYREIFGVRSVALRCGNVYGEFQRGDRSQGLVAAAIRAALDGTELNVFGDGSVVRDYVHVDDVLRVASQLVGRPDAPSVVNVGSGIGTSVRGVLAAVEKVTAREIRVEYHSPRVGEISRVVLDIGLMRSLTGTEPRSLDDGIRGVWSAVIESTARHA